MAGPYGCLGSVYGRPSGVTVQVDPCARALAIQIGYSYPDVDHSYSALSAPCDVAVPSAVAAFAAAVPNGVAALDVAPSLDSDLAASLAASAAVPRPFADEPVSAFAVYDLQAAPRPGVV